MQHDAIQRRSLPERIFHAVCFEGIATAILAPTTAWLMQALGAGNGRPDDIAGNDGHDLEYHL